MLLGIEAHTHVQDANPIMSFRVKHHTECSMLTKKWHAMLEQAHNKIVTVNTTFFVIYFLCNS